MAQTSRSSPAIGGAVPTHSEGDVEVHGLLHEGPGVGGALDRNTQGEVVATSEPVSEVGTGNGTGLGVPSKRHQLGRD